MPYVSPADALNTLSIDLAALRAEHGPAPWRVPLIGTDQMRGALLAFAPGHATVPHHHPHAVELFFIVGGTGRLDIGGVQYAAAPGTLLWSPAGVLHTIIVDGPTDLVLLVSVAPNEDRPDETIEAPRTG